MQTFAIPHVLAREIRVYNKFDPAVPQALFQVETESPAELLQTIHVPLPSKKTAYTCFAKSAQALWMGADNGLTRYEAAPRREADRVMFFSAERDLADNHVQAVYIPDQDTEDVWVLTETAVSHIRLTTLSAEEKAERLTEESKRYVDRHGFITQRDLTVERELSSRVPFGHSDNSGSFTAGFAVGELCKYAYYRKKYGTSHPKTAAARESAVRATEACQLLMYISCRGDGFVARTFLTPGEPVPDDGLFYRIENGKATCLPTTDSKQLGLAGKVIPADAPVPKRLRHLYEDEGHSINGIVYKGDTSSDEITHQYLLIYFAHLILGEEDPELDEIIKTSAKNTLRHIISNDNCLMECNGAPTTWAKWNKEYFASPAGWSDACLNAAQLLMYHKVVMFVTGETEPWAENYRRLTEEEGYAKLTTLHDQRFHISAGNGGLEQVEELMYGDNMLATCAYWLLITLENDPALRKQYKTGYRGWNGTFRREHNPAYDFPYMLSCPEDSIDTDMLCDWFRRQDISRLAAGVSVSARQDVPCRYRFGGMKETACLLMPDERAISKYDRNPYAYTDTHNYRGTYHLESCYVYTFAFWIGKYFGLIEEDPEA